MNDETEFPRGVPVSWETFLELQHAYTRVLEENRKLNEALEYQSDRIAELEADLIHAELGGSE